MLEHADPLPSFADMLNEEYLWSEEYDEDEDILRYEEEEVFPDDLSLASITTPWKCFY